ncbi:RecQ family ATP-dependent DNA helicase, partial [Patescibacteria group bacterium]|nr:RecQ family ATP-dependent DNA helicase [Patescibacteria group bacterium]
MTTKEAKQSLKHAFGFNKFLPMQEEVVKAVLDKKDCLVLMPTGGGKSLCYQLPATVLPGLTVVVSPLIALMKDQVEALVSNGIKAGFINSSIEQDEMKEVEEAVMQGEIKLLYVSPEKMVSSYFQNFLRNLEVSLFAIDEAHCISSWGHDFRKEYTQLKTLKQNFPNIPIIALTATADKLTRRDILGQLSLNNPKIFISSFDRPNLELTVLPGRKRIPKIIDFVKKRKQEAGIIYCLSRKQTEKVAEALQQEGIGAAHYHAGMRSSDRSKVQEDFVHGRVPVICATIAFGMGI